MVKVVAGVRRRTVRQALTSADPLARKVPARPAPRLDPAKALIDAMLVEDLTAPRKQRHTARRIRARLVDEHALSLDPWTGAGGDRRIHSESAF